MYKILLKRAAANDIDDIAGYIQQDNARRAESFTDEISAKIAVIAEHPLMYPARDDVKAGLRADLIGSYLVFFKIHVDSVEIVRVLHGARDLDNLL